MSKTTAKQFIKLCKADRCKTASRSKSKLPHNNFTNKYTQCLGKLGYAGIKKDGYFSKFYPYGVVGHCCIGVQAHFIWAGLEAFVPRYKTGSYKYIWNTNVYHRWLKTNPTIKGYGKVEHVTNHKKAKSGAVAFTPSHTCLVRYIEGDYVHTVDFNVGGKDGMNNGTLHKRHKSKFNGFANMPYPEVTSYAKFTHPMKNHRVSCKYNEGLHRYNSSAKANYRDYPTDLVGKDTGRDWAYAPVDMVVLRRYTNASHCIWLRSYRKVKTPYGIGYIYMMSQHQDNNEMKAVGHIYKKGDKLFREGKNGNATGNHLHVVFGFSEKKITSKTMGTGWIKNNLGAWVMHIPSVKNIKFEQAVYS